MKEKYYGERRGGEREREKKRKHKIKLLTVQINKKEKYKDIYIYQCSFFYSFHNR